MVFRDKTPSGNRGREVELRRKGRSFSFVWGRGLSDSRSQESEGSGEERRRRYLNKATRKGVPWE